MENEDIVGREFTGFKFKDHDLLKYDPSKFDQLIGMRGVVEKLNDSIPEYAYCKFRPAIGKEMAVHFPTALIREQLEEEEFNNKSVEDILNEIKQLNRQI